MGPSDYMFLPYLNYTQPMSLCILGLQDTTETKLDGENYIGLGQRALAKFSFYTVFDREANTATMKLGGAVAQGNSGSGSFAPVVVALAIVAALLILIVYLIVLRSMRLKAEKWLEKNKHILFSHAHKLKSDEEILQAILESPKLENGGQDLGTPVRR